MSASKLGRAPRLVVTVTAEHIKQAVPRNSGHCMIADAIKEAYPHLGYVSVDIQTIRATDRAKKERYVWLTPRSAQMPVLAFDRKKKPEPFSFTLRDGHTVYSGSGGAPKGASKPTLRRPKNGSRSSVPERVGGKAPPRAIGLRREFGLRAFQY